MNTDGTGFNSRKECHKTESIWNHTTTDHKEGEQLEERRNVGESSCNFGDGTDQTVRSLMLWWLWWRRKILRNFIYFACAVILDNKRICRTGAGFKIPKFETSVTVCSLTMEFYFMQMRLYKSTQMKLHSVVYVLCYEC